MQRRKWDSKTKALIVLQGLKGKPVAELCIEHQVSQAQFYQWRDQFLANASKTFDMPTPKKYHWVPPVIINAEVITMKNISFWLPKAYQISEGRIDAG